MAEIVIRLDFRTDGRLSRWLMTAAMMLAVVPELASESVTLTTYYPAPSGVYSQMITTGNTYLARDGGNVGLGTSSPAYKMDIVGSLHATGVTQLDSTLTTNGLITANGGLTIASGFPLTVNAAIQGSYGLIPTYANWALYGTGSGGAAIYNDAASYKTLMLVGNNSAGGVRQVSVWDQLNVNGNQLVNGTSYNSSGEGSASSFVSAAALNTACYWTSYGAGTGTPVCAGGYYVTMNSGYMSKYLVMNDAENPAGDAFCCQCPTIVGWPWGSAGGCPNM